MWIIKLLHVPAPGVPTSAILSDHRNTSPKSESRYSIALSVVNVILKSKIHKSISINYNVVVLNLCDSRSRYKFVSVCILYAVCMQKSVSIFVIPGDLVLLICYLLTPWSRAPLEKLTGSAATQEIPRIFGTQRFLTVPTSARHLSLSWANSSPHNSLQLPEDPF